MLVATYTELACVQLSRDKVQAAHSSHDHPISAAVYVPSYNLLATGCYGGTIILWDLSSGGMVIEYEHAHQGAAVSCLAVGFGGRRLLSGSSTGEIFVWNTLTGLVLMKLEKRDPREVIGILAGDAAGPALGAARRGAVFGGWRWCWCSRLT